MATAKQILDARDAGYSDAEIAQHLSGSGYQKARDAGYSDQEIMNHFLSPGDQTLLGNIASSNNRGPLDDLNQLGGNLVKAGGAGISDLVSGNGLPQASEDITNVENEQPATSTAGKVGSTVGSFFTPQQIVLQALGGAVAKPIATGLGNMASATMRGLSDITPEFAGKVAGYFGAEPGAVAALAENPEAVSNAQSMKSAAEDAGSFVKGIGKRGQALADTATAALDAEKDVVGAGDIAQKTLAKLTNDKSATELAKDSLSDIVKQLQKDPSEANVGDAIDKLDDLIKYNSQSAPDWSNRLRDARQALSTALKTQNPAYKSAIEASAATRVPMKTLSQNLGIKNGLPGDWTINALDKVNDPEALATQRALAALPGGAQLTGNVANAAAKAALQQGLLGKLALLMAPYASSAVQGGVQAAPAAANAVYQGLTQ